MWGNGDSYERGATQEYSQFVYANFLNKNLPSAVVIYG